MTLSKSPFNNISDKYKKKKDKSKIESNSESNSESKIELKSKSKENNRISRTFYINEQDDDYLEILSEKSGRDKSELVRLAIRYFYDNVEVK